MRRLALIVATFGYVGFFPVAPGTAGSLAGLAVYAVVEWIRVPGLEAATILVLFVAGLWATTTAEQVLGGKDPGPAVVDEVVGMMMTLAFMPLSLTGIAIGFVFFRFFDVVKPFPAARLERWPGGWGVMLDDAVAGLYGQVAMRLLAWVLPGWVLA
jgi:phosphatidylglycerophosphatase A